MPTSEELKYFIALKDVINGKMGPWKWHDGWYDQDNDEAGKVVPGQVKFFHDPEYEMHYFVRLPLPIDPDNPERGLVGMIKNLTYLMPDGNSGWIVSIPDDPIPDDPNLKIDQYFYAPTPTLALLKALAWQEGV